MQWCVYLKRTCENILREILTDIWPNTSSFRMSHSTFLCLATLLPWWLRETAYICQSISMFMAWYNNHKPVLHPVTAPGYESMEHIAAHGTRPTSLLGTNFKEILNEIYIFSLRKMHLKMSSGNMLPFCLVLNVLSGTQNIFQCRQSPLSCLVMAWYFLSFPYGLLSWYRTQVQINQPGWQIYVMWREFTKMLT